MVKARLNRVYLTVGDTIELPEGALAATILHNPVTGGYTVAWLEEVKE